MPLVSSKVAFGNLPDIIVELMLNVCVCVYIFWRQTQEVDLVNFCFFFFLKPSLLEIEWVWFVFMNFSRVYIYSWIGSFFHFSVLL